MKRGKDKRIVTELRQRALDELQNAQAAADADSAGAADVLKQLHELQVHRIELEMQNAELEQTRADLESSLARYTDLYDFAPIGYFTLDCNGFILEANLAGADLLGMPRPILFGKYLGNFICHESRRGFSSFLSKVFASREKECCELTVLGADTTPFFVHIEASADRAGKTCRVAMLNVNERRLAEEALRHSQEMLRELVSHQEHVKEDERKRIAREIHDELGQNLLALRLDITMLHERTRNTHPRINKRIDAALSHIDATMKAVRIAINNLRPAVLDLGLVAAIEWQVGDFQRRNGIETDLVIGKIDFALDENHATALFRILQESLSNVVRHAQASRVSIELGSDGDKLVMTVADNGIGIFPECRRKANSFGLLGIAERASALGGELAIDSFEGNGTKLMVSIPLKGEGGAIGPATGTSAMPTPIKPAHERVEFRAVTKNKFY